MEKEGEREKERKERKEEKEKEREGEGGRERAGGGKVSYDIEVQEYVYKSHMNASDIKAYLWVPLHR